MPPIHYPAKGRQRSTTLWGLVAAVLTVTGLGCLFLNRGQFWQNTFDQWAFILSLVWGFCLTAWALFRQGETRRLDQQFAERRQREEQLRKLSRAVEQSPASIVITDRGGRIEYVNPRFCKVTGYTFEEAQGQNPRLLKSGEMPPAAYQNLWQTILAGQEWRGTFHNKRKNGQLYWELASISPIVDESGQVTHFVAVKEDITERKLAEERVRDSQSLLQSTLDALSASIAILDETGVILGVNLGWKNFALKNNFGGQSLGVGLNYLELCESATGTNAEEGVPVATGIRAVMANQLVEFHREYPCHSPEEQRWFRVRVTRFAGAGPVRLVVAHENITQRKQAEAAFEKANLELVEASRLAGMAEVATGVLHNVGNALNSVNVASHCLAAGLGRSKLPYLTKVVALLEEHAGDLGDFLVRDSKGKQVPGYLKQLAEHLAREQAVAQNELAELQQHIEHIKAIVAAQQGLAKRSAGTEIIEVPELVEEALRLNGDAFVNEGVQVTKDFQPGPAIAVDRHKALQILVNLMQNAEQSCQAGAAAEKRLTLRVRHAADRVQISVADNGVGIPTENLTRIFNHGFTTKKTGHGFGLHNSVNAAREMEGRLEAHSAGSGLGATFTLELPYQYKAEGVSCPA